MSVVSGVHCNNPCIKGKMKDNRFRWQLEPYQYRSLPTYIKWLMAIFKAFSIQCQCHLTAVKHTVFADTLPDKPSGYEWEQLKEWKGTGSHFFQVIPSQCPGGRTVLTAEDGTCWKAGSRSSAGPALARKAVLPTDLSGRPGHCCWAEAGAAALKGEAGPALNKAGRAYLTFIMIANTCMHSCKLFVLVNSFNPQINPMRSVFLLVPGYSGGIWGSARRLRNLPGSTQ